MSYATQTASALRMLKQKGVALTMTRKTAGTHDPIAQTTTGRATENQPIQVVILPASESRDMTFAQRALVRKNQRNLIVAGKAPDGTALAFEPTSGHTVAFESSTWVMQGVSRLGPDGGAPIIFRVEVTR